MTYNFTFTEPEVNIILAALSELPAKNSIDLILKIKEEAVAQMRENPEAVEVEAEEITEDES